MRLEFLHDIKKAIIDVGFSVKLDLQYQLIGARENLPMTSAEETDGSSHAGRRTCVLDLCPASRMFGEKVDMDEKPLAKTWGRFVDGTHLDLIQIAQGVSDIQRPIL